jgi:hypothetical protein
MLHLLEISPFRVPIFEQDRPSQRTTAPAEMVAPIHPLASNGIIAAVLAKGGIKCQLGLGWRSNSVAMQIGSPKWGWDLTTPVHEKPITNDSNGAAIVSEKIPALLVVHAGV